MIASNFYGRAPTFDEKTQNWISPVFSGEFAVWSEVANFIEAEPHSKNGL